MIIWIIGLSGSGKTSLGNELINQLNSSQEKWMIMDGDNFRSILGEELGHKIEDRKKIGERLVNLSLEFSRQNKNLIVCLLSIFPEHQKKMRDSVKDYKEIFINVSLRKLKERDNKNLYKKAEKGEIENVVGIDIEFPKPKNPDLIINNNQNISSFSNIASNVLKTFGLNEKKYEYSSKNLLEKKEKYEYSNYLGESFLDLYSISREKTKKNINEKILYLSQFHKYKKSISYFLFKDEKRINPLLLKKEFLNIKQDLKGSINSKFLLVSWLKSLAKNKSINENIEKKVLIFLKRFEVSKKIYEGYTKKDIKKSGEAVRTLDVYILFGILLGELYEISNSKKKKIIYFNTMIKVCDLVESSLENLTSPGEIFLSEKLFLKENHIFKILKRELD